MKGDGPGMSPGGIHPSGTRYSCPSCGREFVGDPPHPWSKDPCPDCGYRGGDADGA